MVKIRFGATSDILYDGIVFHWHQPDFNIPHDHDCYEFTLITKGLYEHIINGREEMLSENSAIFLGLNDVHQAKILNENSKRLNILIEKNRFKTFCNGISPDLFNLFNKSFPLKTKLNTAYKNKIFTYLENIKISKEPFTNIISSLIISEIIEIFIRDLISDKKDSYTKKFKNILLECNSSKNLGWKASDVANYSGYSPTHLNRLFRKYLNCSVTDYLIKIKLDAAKNMLITTNYSINKISQKLGYSSVSYFNNIFADHFHLTPYQYKLNYFKKN